MNTQPIVTLLQFPIVFRFNLYYISIMSEKLIPFPDSLDVESATPRFQVCKYFVYGACIFNRLNPDVLTAPKLSYTDESSSTSVPSLKTYGCYAADLSIVEMRQFQKNECDSFQE